MCECLSFTMSGPPCQPIDVSKSKHVYSHKSQLTVKKKSYSRSIHPSWYKKHPWITVFTTKYKVFCHSCCYSRKKGLLTFSKRQLNCFVEDEFCNWKKALEKFLEHERSDMHKEAVLKQVAHNSSTNVSAQHSTQCKEAQNLHQCMLLKLISSIRFLASQSMPLRGRHEDLASLDSNLYKLLLLRAEDCPEMKTWIYRKEYTS